MNRRDLFRTALAGAVLGLTRHLPMPASDWTAKIGDRPFTVDDLNQGIDDCHEFHVMLHVNQVLKDFYTKPVVDWLNAESVLSRHLKERRDV